MEKGLRKFILSAFFAISGTVALFVGKLSGGEYLGLVGTISTLYGAANIYAKIIAKNGKENK